MSKSSPVIWISCFLLLLSALLPAHVATAAAPGAREWLIMLYQNADDPVLEGDIFTDLNEAEWVGSSDAVTIVAQLDRYDGEFDGDGDWTGTKRFLIEQDDDLTTVNSTEIADLGEVDSGSPKALIDFATWAMKTYPAKKYALILSDHGAGWVGGWNDDAPKEGSALTLYDIDQALATILQRTRVPIFELIGFDACLMSSVEVLAAVAPYARHAVASQETEPALGWAYAKFLDQLVTRPTQNGAGLARAIVTSYIVNDLRITDTKARTDYLDELGEATATTARALSQTMRADTTLTAVNLTKFSGFVTALNDFLLALTVADPVAIAKARTYAQSFETVFDPEEPSPYIDLGNFANLVTDFAEVPELTETLTALQKAYRATIIAETHGPERPGASGLSLFFPTPDLLAAVGYADSDPAYSAYASRFVGASLWDEFLRFHYLNQDFDPDLVDLSLLDPRTGPKADLSDYAAPLLTDEDEITTPGVDTELTMTPLEVSEDTIATDESLLLATQIEGENVGYIYIEVNRYDEENDLYLLEDLDYVASDVSAAIDGVIYPQWRADDLDDFIYEWEPTVYTLQSGDEEAVVLFMPEIYGKGQRDTDYVVHGIYTLANSGAERYALMHFDGDLNFKSIFGFQDLDGTGAPRQITPRQGDTFTVLDHWYTINDDGEWILEKSPGTTLTYTGQPFTAEAYTSDPGE
ncbi:MAG TPA: clostripain-related cysteine peptidase, partial [Caldilineaceae bacterium]|nr:clostripain-related cysteine peptidase [Caldilineaceae bacterium]